MELNAEPTERNPAYFGPGSALGAMLDAALGINNATEGNSGGKTPFPVDKERDVTRWENAVVTQPSRTSRG